MYAKNVTEQQIKEIAKVCGFSADTTDEGYRVRFTLRNHSDSFWAVSRNLWGNDRTYRTKVCYHGHWKFLRKLFDVYPDAVVDAGWYRRVRYTADNFEEEAEKVGDTIVRQWDQLRVRDKCSCEEKVMDVRGCPHLIMVAEHYRPDGRCRCYDPLHKVMEEWGYTWKDGQWR